MTCDYPDSSPLYRRRFGGGVCKFNNMKYAVVIATTRIAKTPVARSKNSKPTTASRIGVPTMSIHPFQCVPPLRISCVFDPALTQVRRVHRITHRAGAPFRGLSFPDSPSLIVYY